MQKDYQGPFRLRCAEVCRGALWKPLARRYTNVAVSRRVVDNAEFALTERVGYCIIRTYVRTYVLHVQKRREISGRKEEN